MKVYFAGIACFLASLIFFWQQTSLLKDATQKHIDTIENYEVNVRVGSLIPAIDIRDEILNQSPSLAGEAKSILNIRGKNPQSYSDFKTLFNYFYVISDHTSAINLFTDYLGNLDRRTINRLVFLADRNYLLPAYLYERLGELALAAFYYTSYLKMIRQLSVQEDMYRDKSFQRRLTITRVKVSNTKIFDDEYYHASYFSAVIADFFEFTTKKRFLSPYVDAGLIDSVAEDPKYIWFNSSALNQYLKTTSMEQNPYAHYEYCVYVLSNYQPESCDYNGLRDRLGKNHILYGLLSLSFAQHKTAAQDYYGAIQVLSEIQKNQNHDYVFLQDDAHFFHSLALYKSGKRQEAMTMMSELVESYSSDGFDAVDRAVATLNSWRNASAY